MFCPSCGKEIPDHSSFCLGCGKAVRLASQQQPNHPRPLSSQHGAGSGAAGAGNRRFSPLGVVVIAVFLVFLLLTVIKTSQVSAPGSISRSALRPFSKPLLLGSVAVPALRARYWNFEISPTMTNAHVVGTFRAQGGVGNDIEAALGEAGECENWMNGHPAQLLYRSGKVTNGRLDVPIREAGRYCLAFSNKMALLSAKTVSGSVELQYLLP